ncbi:hypothetical protein D049_4284A, partial [Vibrio parahaemolyticus VPTS-2010]
MESPCAGRPLRHVEVIPGSRYARNVPSSYNSLFRFHV